MTSSNRVSKIMARKSKTIKTQGKESREGYRSERDKKHDRSNRNTKQSWVLVEA